MAKHGRGLICLALDKKQTNKLGLSLMPSRNSSRLKTAFTVSIEARRGVYWDLRIRSCKNNFSCY